MRKLLKIGIIFTLITLSYVLWVSHKIEMETPSPIYTYKVPDLVTSIAWSPDNSKLAIGSFDHKIYILNTINWQPGTALEEHSGWVLSLAWSPSGNMLASTGKDGRLNIWNMVSDKTVTTISGQYSVGGTLIWLSENTLTYIGNRLNVWDVDSGELLNSLPIHEKPWEIKDGLIAIVSANNDIEIRDIYSAEMLHKYNSSEALSSIAWAPDGSKVAAGGPNGTLIIWDVEDEEEISRLVNQYGILDLAWSPDGTQLAALVGQMGGPSKAYVWNLETEISPIVLEPPPNTFTRWLAWSPNGKLLACVFWSEAGLTGAFGNYVEFSKTLVWRSEKGTLLDTFENSFLINQVPKWNLDGTLLATGGETEMTIWRISK